MHRTEGQYHKENLFNDGPPGTRVEQNWLNAVQEELCYVIEQAGIALKTASTDTRSQLKIAIDALLGAAVNAHNSVTNPHSSSASAIADRIALRDAAGRCEFAGGIAGNDAVVFSQFAGSFSAPNAGTNYQKFASGLILQWGYFSITTPNADQVVTYPLTFPNIAIGFWTGLFNAAYDQIGHDIISTTNARITLGLTDIAEPGLNRSGFWFVLGY